MTHFADTADRILPFPTVKEEQPVENELVRQDLPKTKLDWVLYYGQQKDYHSLLDIATLEEHEIARVAWATLDQICSTEPGLEGELKKVIGPDFQTTQNAAQLLMKHYQHQPHGIINLWESANMGSEFELIHVRNTAFKLIKPYKRVLEPKKILQQVPKPFGYMMGTVVNELLLRLMKVGFLREEVSALMGEKKEIKEAYFSKDFDALKNTILQSRAKKAEYALQRLFDLYNDVICDYQERQRIRGIAFEVIEAQPLVYEKAIRLLFEKAGIAHSSVKHLEDMENGHIRLYYWFEPKGLLKKIGFKPGLKTVVCGTPEFYEATG